MRTGLSTLTLLCSLALCAQTRKDYDLERDYGLSFLHGKALVKNLVADSNAAKTKYPRLWARLSGQGKKASFLMNMNALPAAWNDAVLQGQGGGQPITGRITSNNGIRCPAGYYEVNYPCIVDGGEYRGAGTGYSGTTSLVSMNTTLHLNRAGWLGEKQAMNLMQSSTWGVMSGATAYFESTFIDGFRYEGDAPIGSKHDASYSSAGLAIWDMGETGRVGRIHASMFNGYGLLIVRGTPATIDVVSAHNNTLGGVGGIGNDLSTIRIGTLSGDENGALLYIRPGFGREGGGTWEIALTKCETGKAKPSRGQVVLDAVGYLRAHFGSVWYSAQQTLIDAAFVISSKGVGSAVAVDNFSGEGFASLLQDIGNKKRWTSPGPFVPIGFRWDSRSGGSLSSTPGLTPSACPCSARLGVRTSAGAYDYTGCAPKYAYTK